MDTPGLHFTDLPVTDEKQYNCFLLVVVEVLVEVLEELVLGVMIVVVVCVMFFTVGLMVSAVWFWNGME